MSDVNIDVAMPNTSTVANPRTAPAPKNNRTRPAISAVTFESAMAENARSNPAVIADVVLLANVVLLIALLSIFGAALTLPGIAAVVLTVGMAVDANILIYERIREELRNGVSPRAAITAGFDRAFSAIADSNVTALIAGLVLWLFGAGAVRGFAVVLVIGIATSMFTSLMGSRALVQIIYGGKRKVERLSI